MGKFKCSDATRYKSATSCVLTSGDHIKGEILLSGPVVALMYVYNDFLVYRDGIYSPMTTSMPVINSAREPAMHAVKIIGWGEENGVDYWIIENSFGEDWGQRGFGYVQRSHVEHGPDYNPALSRDVVILENFVIATTPLNP